MRKSRHVFYFFLLLLVAPASSALAQDVDRSTPKHQASNWDERLLISINHWGVTSPGLDGTANFLSNTVTVPMVAVPIALYGLGVVNANRGGGSTGLAIGGLAIGTGEALAGILTQGIKLVVRRDRPYHVLEDVRTPSNGDGGFSFPSGHAAGVWSLAAGLSLQYQKWYVIAPAALYATLVSLSRSYLGVHYVTDLLAGAVVGVGCSYLVYRNEDKLTQLFSGLLPKGNGTGQSGMVIMPNLGPGGFGMSMSLGLLQPASLGGR